MAATTMQKKQLREMVAEQARNMAALEMKTAAANPRCSESGAAEKTGGNVLHEHDKWLQDTKNPNCNCEPPPPQSWRGCFFMAGFQFATSTPRSVSIDLKMSS